MAACASTPLLPKEASLKGAGAETFSVSYCPDNTCEILKFKKPVNNIKARDILWSYLFGISDYIYLENWRPGQRQKAVKFLDNYGQRHEKPLKDLEALKKDVKEVHNKNFESLYSAEFIRYDEGEKHSNPL